MTHTVLVVGDHQAPYHDQDAIDAVNAYARVLKPDEVVINGDMMDFPTLTTKYARSAVDETSLLEELEVGKSLLAGIRAAVGRRARIVYNEGNHEHRMRVMLQERAPSLEPLALDAHPLSLPSLLDMPRYNVEYRAGWRAGTAYWERDGLVITHGNWHSSTAARKHREFYGSVVFSHLHRPALDSTRTYDGAAHIGWGIGCLCNVRGENMPPRAATTPSADWVQGFGVVRFANRGYQVFQHNIAVAGLVIGHDGREYTA